MSVPAKSSDDACVSSLPSALSNMSSRTADAGAVVDLEPASWNPHAGHIFLPPWKPTRLHSVQIRLPVHPPPSYSPASPPAQILPSPSFPEGCVYDPRLSRDQYVDDSYTLRSGVLFDTLPSGPLSPAILPKRTTGKTYFYCVTRGLKVGVVTDVTEAVAQTAGVSHAMNFKLSSHSAALEYFNDELAKGNVKLCHPRRHRPLSVHA
ncbi:hypothetical protein BDZ89DRAFT_1152658 [Hymenopellis radicata]|nr:hypothetical protein BDZ89DRAFT_1152658 [Hymenopellis radicata]